MIDKSTRIENDRIIQKITLDKVDRKLLKVRSDAVRNLKAIVITIWLSTLFNVIYSIVVRALYGQDCYPPSNNLVLDFLLKTLDRLDAYVFWMYPIIYLFWPTRSNLVQEKRVTKVQNSYRVSTERYSAVQIPRAADSSSSDDDQDFNYSGTGTYAVTGMVLKSNPGVTNS